MGLVRELFRFRRYKGNQGRLIRRMSMAGVWLLFATGAWKCTQMDFTWLANLAGWTEQSGGTVPYLLSGVVVLIGLWLGYRLVNWTTFADFLISVEAEMVKVSWPGSKELYSSTVVVLTVFVLLAAMIYVFDLVWVFLFKLTGVV